MSELVIKDGTGGGFRAGVTSENKLLTAATSRPEYANASTRGDTHFFGTGIFTMNTTHDNIFFMRNLSVRPFAIHKIVFSWDGGATESHAFFHVHLNPSTPTANDTAVSPFSMNLGTPATGELDIRKWNGVGTGMPVVSSGNKALELILNHGTGLFEFDGALILPQQASLICSLYGESEVGMGGINVTGFFLSE